MVKQIDQPITEADYSGQGNRHTEFLGLAIHRISCPVHVEYHCDILLQMVAYLIMSAVNNYLYSEQESLSNTFL